jgi:hypothetical protein
MSRREILRQGDVLLVRVDALPEGVVRLRRRGGIVLAECEATGHVHVVASRDAVVYAGRESDERYLLVRGNRRALLRHEEHDPIAVAPGVSEVRRQREYDPGRSARWIAD